MANAAGSRFLGEARGVMATGDAEDVMEYATRLKDLEEFGMHDQLHALKFLENELRVAERARIAASKKFHKAAEKLLDEAVRQWGAADVIVALFGDRSDEG